MNNLSGFEHKDNFHSYPVFRNLSMMETNEYGSQGQTEDMKIKWEWAGFAAGFRTVKDGSDLILSVAEILLNLILLPFSILESIKFVRRRDVKDVES